MELTCFHFNEKGSLDKRARAMPRKKKRGEVIESLIEYPKGNN
jgi:hypothetical protein